MKSNLKFQNQERLHLSNLMLWLANEIGNMGCNLRVPFEKAVQVVSLLCESTGIRACERLTGLNRRTVLNILKVAGEKAAEFMDERIRDVRAEWIQADEIHS